MKSLIRHWRLFLIQWLITAAVTTGVGSIMPAYHLIALVCLTILSGTVFAIASDRLDHRDEQRRRRAVELERRKRLELEREMRRPLLTIVQDAEREGERLYYADHPDEKPEPRLHDHPFQPPHPNGRCTCPKIDANGMEEPADIDPTAMIDVRDDSKPFKIIDKRGLVPQLIDSKTLDHPNRIRRELTAAAAADCPDCDWNMIEECTFAGPDTTYRVLSQPCNTHEYARGYTITRQVRR